MVWAVAVAVIFLPFCEVLYHLVEVTGDISLTIPEQFFTLGIVYLRSERVSRVAVSSVV